MNVKLLLERISLDFHNLLLLTFVTTIVRFMQTSVVAFVTYMNTRERERVTRNKKPALWSLENN